MWADLRAFHLRTHPGPTASRDQLFAWNDTQYSPYLHQRVGATCDALYRLGVPSPSVEAFRQHATEGH
jgi:hypothetical protein